MINNDDDLGGSVPDFSSFGSPIDTSSSTSTPDAAPEPAPRRSAFAWAPDVDDALETASKEFGVDRGLLDTFARIESSGNPHARKGSYKGLFALPDNLFNQYGGQGDIFDPYENARAGAAKLRAEKADFAKRYGRDPSAAELYMIHQQGPGGATAHWSNPDAPAWQNMYSTAEGRQRGANWARRAIWGNIPDDMKRQFGSVDNVSSRDFTKLWEDKVARFGGGTAASGTQLAAATKRPPGMMSLGGPVAADDEDEEGTVSNPLLSVSDVEPDDDEMGADPETDEDGGPMFLGGPTDDKPDFSKYGKPLGKAATPAGAGAPDFSKFGKPVKPTIDANDPATAQKPVSTDGYGDGKLENIVNPQQYKELAKGVIPGAISMQGTALQAPDAFAVKAQHSARDFGAKQLEVMDRIDRGDTVPETEDAFGYQHMGPEDRAKARKDTLEAQAAFNPTPIQDRTLFKKGQEVQEYAKDLFPAAPGYEKSVGRQLGEGLGSMLGGMPYGVFGRAPAALFFGAAGSGEAAQRAVEFDKKDRAAGGPGLTQEQIALAGIAGVAPGTTDLLPLETLMGRLPLHVPEAAKRPLAQAIARIGGQAFIEGLQEGGQQFLQNFIAREVYNPKQDLGEEVWPNTGIGAGVGGIAQTGKEVGSGLVKLAGGRRARGSGAAPEAGEDEAQKALPAPPKQITGPQGEQPAQETMPPPASADEAGWLRARGFDDKSIAEMSPDERAAEIEEAKAQGLKPVAASMVPNPLSGPSLAEDNPTAEPVGDLLAQAADLNDPKNDRSAVYVPKSSLDALDEKSTEQLAQAMGDNLVLQNFDDKGGHLVVADYETAKAALEAKAAGEDLQKIIGQATGAGSGKPADGSVVVQQRTKDGAVTRESLVTPDQVDATRKAFARAGHEVEVLSPQEALQRREDMIAQQSVPARESSASEAAKDSAREQGTRSAPVRVESAKDVAAAGQRVVEPTEAQRESGNYKKGHLNYKGLQISIETPKGAMRRGDGWEVVSPAAYGYFKGVSARAGDKEHVDVYVGDNVQSDAAFIVDQHDLKTGRFDEPKVILGARSAADAASIYDAGFSDGKGPERRRAVSQVSIDQLKDWLDNGDATKPFARKGTARAAQDAGVQGLAERGGPLSESEQSVLPQLRGPGDQAAPGVGEELRGVPGRSGREAGPVDDVGSQGQREGVRAGQRALGDQEGASAQYAQEPRSDAQRPDADADSVGRRDRSGAIDASVSAEAGRDDRGGSVERSAEGRQTPKWDGPELSPDEIDLIVTNWKYVRDVAAMPKPQTLTQYVIGEGGLQDGAREVRHIMGAAKERPGLVNQNGVTLDDMALKAWEAGFFEDSERPTIADFLDKLQDDLHTGAEVRLIDQDALDSIRIAGEIAEELNDYGVTASKFRSEASLREYFGQARAKAAQPAEGAESQEAAGRESADAAGDVIDEAPFGSELEGEGAVSRDQARVDERAGRVRDREDQDQQGAEPATGARDSGEDRGPAGTGSGERGSGVEGARETGPSDSRGADQLADYRGQHIDGYNDDGQQKHRFLTDARNYLTKVAKILKAEGFEAFPDKKGKAGRPVNVNQAGPAVSGNVSLNLIDADGNAVFANINGSPGTLYKGEMAGVRIYARKASEGDRYGAKSANQWLDDDLTAQEFAAKLIEIARPPSAPAAITTEKSGQTSLVPEPTTKEKIAAEAKAKERKGGNEPMDVGMFGSEKDQTDLVDMAKEEPKPAKPSRLGQGLSDLMAKSGGQAKAVETVAAGAKAPAETASPQQKLVDRLMGDGFKTIIEARKFAKEIGLDGSNKEIDETIERAVVTAARQIVAEGEDPRATFQTLVDLYGRQPNLASRTGTSVANQAYSTPMPLAYLASRLAGAATADVVYEPTAGNGALLMEAGPGNDAVYANEIDPARAAALEGFGFTVSQEDAGSARKIEQPADAIVANPPFGAVKEGGQSRVFKVGTWSTTQIDHAVSLHALDNLTDGGRAVLILGGTKSESTDERRKDYRGKAKREFYARLYKDYNVTDHFTVSGDLYTKQGASWPVDVIVIDGRGQSERKLPAAQPPEILKTWDQVAEKLPNATSAGRNELAARPVDRQAGKPAVAGAEPAGRDGSDRKAPVGRGSERVQPEAEGSPAAVRAERAQGESADVGSRGRDDAAKPASDRDGGRVDQPAAAQPVRPRVNREAPKGGQAFYEPTSTAASLDTLIPVNMASAARDAMAKVEQRRGSVDELVADRLGYDARELGQYFSAEQVDALAAAIDNVERGAAFVIGDQTGLGKGRVSAGMLRYAMRRGEIPVFLTEKPDLYGDMYRDLRDIGVPEMLGREPRMFITNAGETITLDEEALTWKQESEEARRNGEPLPKKRGKFLVGGTAAKVQEGMRKIAAGEDIADVIFTTYDQLNTVKGATTPRRTFLSQIAPQSMIVMDECVPSGTQIATPDGLRTIEDIRVGDLVLGYNHERHVVEPTPVLHTFRRQTLEPLYDMGGVSVTGAHPVFTENRGYVPAADLESSDFVLHIEQHASTQTEEAHPELRALRSGVRAQGQTAWEQGAVLQPLLRRVVVRDIWAQSESGQDTKLAGGYAGAAGEASPHVEQSVQRSGVAAAERGDGEDARESALDRRQWSGNVAAANALASASRMDTGARGGDRVAREGNANALQDRHSVPGTQDRDRGGWSGPSQHEGQGSGRPQGIVLALSRVDGPALSESTGDGRTGRGRRRDHDGIEVFNIETGTANYFANGLLVHNCHNAGGQAKTGWEKKDAVMNRADFARELAAKAKGVMFSSATYAKRPDVMDLYARTDMGKAVDDPKELGDLIQRGGVPMQQIVASMLAKSGQYLRRERSFDGVDYQLTPVPVNLKAYKQFSASMQAIFRFDLAVEEFRAEWGQDKLDEMGWKKSKDDGVGGGSASSVAFGSLMHNITNQMLLAIKAEQTAQQAIKAHKAGEKPVIALANTNESFIKDFAEAEDIKIGKPLDLDFSAVLERYLSRTLRVTVKGPENEKKHLQIPIDELPLSLRQEFRAAMNAVKEGDYSSLPISPIDWIRFRLGEAGMSVKEVTGRQTMIDYSKPVPTYVQRPKSEQGASGKRGSIAYFNSGKLDALILNRSGSTGVSMHASSSFKDKRRRRMILAQAEGNIDTHLQMLGRVHRTGQVIPPAYAQIAAEIPAEARPTAVLMKKMASLNANTTGARSSAFTVDSVDFINEVGDKVVADILDEDPDLNEQLGGPLKREENGKLKIEDVARKATGRLVLLDPEVQSKFLDQVQKAYLAEIEQLDALGENPLEAKTVDLQAKTIEVSELKPTQGDSPFLDAVRMEKVSAKAQGRAMAPSEVAGKIADALKVSKPSGSDAQVLASLEAQGRNWGTKETDRVSALIRKQMAEEIAEIGVDAKESTRRRLEAQYQRWNETMGLVYPGARVRLGMQAGDLDAVVMSVERTGKAKQMGALSAWTVKFAVPDSMRQLDFPMSKLFPPGTPKAEDEKGATLTRAGTSHNDLVDAFEQARKEGRETRYIMTGNILGGFDQTRGRGRIVNFTNDKGDLRPGILMGREFSAEKFMDNRAVRFQNAGQILEFMEKAPLAKVEASQGSIELSQYRDTYRIEMSSARAKAGQFFTDAAVRQAIRPLEFEKRGPRMVVDGLTKKQFVKAVEEMQKIGAKFEVRDQQDLAQSIVSKPSGGSAFAVGSDLEAAGVPKRTDYKTAIPDIRRAMGSILKSGRPVSINGEVVTAVHKAVDEVRGMVPAGANVYTLARVEPSEEAGTVIAVFTDRDGNELPVIESWNYISGIRAFAWEGDIFFVRLNARSLRDIGKFNSSIAAELGHEVVHTLRNGGALIGNTWSRLLTHAKTLRLLDSDFGTYLKVVGDAAADKVPDKSVGDVYRKLYSTRDNPVEMMDQEEVAHLIEWYMRGELSRAEVEPVIDLIDDITAGRIETVGRDESLEMEFAYAAADQGRAQRRELDRLGFYSKALEAAKDLRQAKGTPEQMRAMLRTAGVKEAELAAVGFDGFLAGKTSVTKDEIVSFLEENRVEVREEQYSGRKGSNEPVSRWQSYSIDPSNPTYRETVIHLPSSADQFEARYREVHAEIVELNQKSTRQQGRLSGADAERIIALEAERNDLLKAMNDAKKENFTSGHWSEPNVIAHARTSLQKTADGKTVFLVDELQSDWGQKIRDRGVRDEEKLAELERRFEDGLKRFNESVAAAFPGEDPEYVSVHRLPPEIRAIDDELSLIMAERDTAKAATPGHPLVNTTDQWTTTAFRRLIRQAVEAGADYIALTPGKVQVERFGLEHHVDRLSYHKRDDGTYDLSFVPKTGGIQAGQTLGEKIAPDKLDQYVGREVADKIRAGEGARDNWVANNEPGYIWHVMRPSDLRVGGSGMKATYDSIYPRTLGKLLGKMDPAAGKMADQALTSSLDGEVFHGGFDRTRFPEGNPSAEPIPFHTFPLTGKVKESVMEDGQPMFAIQAFHGSPHDFDKFSLEHIGRGEGAQAFGPGLYFAENKRVSESYAAKLGGGRGVAKIEVDGDSREKALADYEAKRAEARTTEARRHELARIADSLYDNGYRGADGSIANALENYAKTRYRDTYYASEHRSVTSNIERTYASSVSVRDLKDGAKEIIFDPKMKGKRRREWFKDSRMVVAADGTITEVGKRFSDRRIGTKLVDLIGWDDARAILKDRGHNVKSIVFGSPNRYGTTTPSLAAAKLIERLGSREAAVAAQQEEVERKKADVARYSRLNPLNADRRRAAERSLEHAEATLQTIVKGEEEKGIPFADLITEARVVEPQYEKDQANGFPPADNRFKSIFLQDEGADELSSYPSLADFEANHQSAVKIAEDKTIGDEELAEMADRGGPELVAQAIRELRGLAASGRLTWTQIAHRDTGLYEVHLHVEPEQLLDWDKPLSQQSPYVAQALKSLGGFPGFFSRLRSMLVPSSSNRFGRTGNDSVSGLITGKDQEKLRQALLSAGIPGIRYFDGGSRRNGEGTRNYVIFDDSKIEITKKHGEPVTSQERDDVMASLIGRARDRVIGHVLDRRNPEGNGIIGDGKWVTKKYPYAKGTYDAFMVGDTEMGIVSKTESEPNAPYVAMFGRMPGLRRNFEPRRFATREAAMAWMSQAYREFVTQSKTDYLAKQSGSASTFGGRAGALPSWISANDRFPKISPEQQVAVSKDITEAINIVNRIAGREVEVRFQETITPLPGSTEQPLGAYRRPRLNAGAIITLATGNEDLLTTAGHEAWHHVETVLATDAERKLLSAPAEMRRMRAQVADEIGMDASDPRLDQIPNTEIRAIAFQKYRREREEGRQPEGIHIGVRRFWDRMLKVLAVVRNALAGHGLKTYEDVFEAARTGEIASRQAETPSPEARNDAIVRQDEAIAAEPQDVNDVMASLIPRVIQQSVARTMRRFEVGERVDRLRVGIQDKFLPVRRIQEEKERQAGTKVAINLDTYVAEALFHGRAGEQTADLKTDYIEPLVEILRKADISKTQFDSYLYARHAQERNAEIAKINPGLTSGSGMTDAEANTILAAARGKQAAYDQAAKLVDAMIEETRTRLLRSGLISRETFDAWATKFANYVPLRGFEAGQDEPDRPRSGRGFDIRGPEAMQALGRRSKADSPLAYALMQAQQAIIRAEKNRVDKTLYRFIQAYPDPSLYQIYRGEYRRRLNPVTKQVESYWVPPQFVRDDAIHGVKIGGKQYYMELKDPGLARAMRGVQGDQHNAVLRGMMWLSRTYASLLTSYNPEFVISNFMRDIQTALLNVTDVADKPAATRRQIVADALSMKSIRGVLNALRGDGGADYARWFEEYRQAGGKISFMEFNDVERIQRDVTKSIERGRFSRVTRKAFKLVEDVNTAVENGVRLSTYIAMRKAGIGQDRAAFVARELTVNFNRKGEWSPLINSMYLFFNASVQGNVRMMQAVAKSRTLQVAVASIMGGAFMLDWWNYLIAGDDDDGENRWDKLEHWKKERNLIIMTGRADGSYIQIPMPYGYNLFWFGAQQTGAVMRGAVKPHKAAVNMASSMIDVISPIGGASGSVAQLASPTMVDPFIQVLENKNWYGGPIFPTKYNKNLPDSENAFGSVNPRFQDLARVINSVTGGNTARKGAIDISPEVIEHFFEFAGGGVAKFINNVATAGGRVLNGEEWLPEKTPFVRRVYGKATTESRRSDFHKAWEEVDAAKFEIDNLIKNTRKGTARQDEIQTAREKHAVELQAYGFMRDTQRALSAMRKERTTIELNRDLTRAEKEAKLKEIQDRENGLILRSLGQLNKLKKQSKQQPRAEAAE